MHPKNKHRCPHPWALYVCSQCLFQSQARELLVWGLWKTNSLSRYKSVFIRIGRSSSKVDYGSVMLTGSKIAMSLDVKCSAFLVAFFLISLRSCHYEEICSCLLTLKTHSPLWAPGRWENAFSALLGLSTHFVKVLTGPAVNRALSQFPAGSRAPGVGGCVLFFFVVRAPNTKPDTSTSSITILVFAELRWKTLFLLQTVPAQSRGSVKVYFSENVGNFGS